MFALYLVCQPGGWPVDCLREVSQPFVMVALCIEVCYLMAESYLSCVLLVDIDCHHNNYVHTVEGRVSCKLEKEFEVVFAYRTSNPSIGNSSVGVKPEA